MKVHLVTLWRQIFAPVLRCWAAAAKLAVRRYTLRKLRLLVDAADEKLHAAQVRLQNDLSVSVRVESPRIARPAVDTVQSVGPIAHDEFVPSGVSGRVSSDHQPQRSAPARSYAEWEARRSGFTPVTKKEARRNRQRKSARDFDLSFAR